MLQQKKSKVNGRYEFDLINESLKKEYKKQLEAEQEQKKWERLYRAVLTDNTLTQEEKEKIISACHRLNLPSI